MHPASTLTRSADGELHNLQFVREPIIDLHDGRAVAHELLARPSNGQGFEEWARPHLRRSSAAVTRIALAHAGRSMTGLLPTHVNATALDLESATFADDVLGTVAPELLTMLVIEVTEAFPFTSPAAAKRTLAELRSHGVRFAVDDFGEGYANFASLQIIEPEIVKVTVAGLCDGGTRPTTAWFTRMCDRIGATSVIEQIETAAQAAWAADAGFTAAQGYHWAA